MDFLGNVFILAHAVCLVVLEINMYEYQVSKGLLILGVGLISIRTFSMLGIFSYFRFQLEMVRNTAIDIIKFLFLLVLMVIIFTLLQKISQTTIVGQKVTKSFNFIQSIGSNYELLLGDNVTTNHQTSNDWLIFIVFTVMINLILLNLLISVVFNTFDRIQHSMESLQCKNKAKLLLEISSFFSTYNEDPSQLKFFYIFRYTSECGSMKSQDKW